MGEKIATRAAYGQALVKFGKEEPDLVVLDADLSGSTMSGKFAKEYPERFFASVNGGPTVGVRNIMQPPRVAMMVSCAEFCWRPPDHRGCF